MNQIKPGSVRFPYKIAIDYSSAPFAVYVSDFVNNRVLGWRDSVRFRNGDPADFVIGQPNLRTALANVDTQGSANPSRTSLSAPSGMAVNPNDGTLYVGDSGNNRVLRFPRPVTIGLARLAEPIERGQRVARYSLHGAMDGDWKELSRGTTIGFTKIDRFPATTATRVRLSVEDAVDVPERVSVRLYA